MHKKGLTLKNTPVKYSLDKLAGLVYNILSSPKYLMKKQRCFSKILVVCVGSIADSILSLPTIEALGKYYKRSEITVLTSPECEFLFEEKDYVKDILLISSDYLLNPSKENFKSFISEYKQVFKTLQKERFDLTFELRTCPKSVFFFANPILAKRRIGYGNEGLGYLLTDNLNYNYNVHELVNKIELLKPIHVPVETPKVSKTLKIKLKTTSMEKGKDIIKAWNIKKDDKIICLGLNYFEEEQTLPIEKQEELVEQILNKYPKLKIIIINNGSLESSDLGVKLAENIAKAEFKRIFYASVDELGLEAISGILSEAALYIGSNLDFLHLASAINTKTVGLFGNIDIKRWKAFAKGKKHKSVYATGKNISEADKEIINIDIAKVMQTLEKLKI